MSLDLSAMMARKDHVVGELTANVRKLLEGNGIAIFHGTARLAGNGTVAVALNVNITYHRAPSANSTLRAEAKEVSKTRKTGNYYITVKDDRGQLIASCQALAYRKGEKLPFLE